MNLTTDDIRALDHAERGSLDDRDRAALRELLRQLEPSGLQHKSVHGSARRPDVRPRPWASPAVVDRLADAMMDGASLDDDRIETTLGDLVGPHRFTPNQVLLLLLHVARGMHAINDRNKERNERLCAHDSRINGLEREKGTEATVDARDMGIWESGKTYPAGALVSWNGNTFVSQRETRSEPLSGSGNWRLSARRGKTGKEGRPGRDASPEVIKQVVLDTLRECGLVP